MAITKIKALGVTANTITASQIANDTITNTQINTSAAIAATKLGTLASANMPAGSVLQAITSTTDTQQSLSASTTWADITGLTVNITPKATSNIINVTGTIYIGSGSNPNGGIRCYRSETSGGGNAAAVGATASGDSNFIRGDAFWNSDDFGGLNYTLFAIPFFLKDTAPSTNQLTYKLQWASSSAVTQYINYPSNGTNYGRGTHSITVMEIKA